MFEDWKQAWRRAVENFERELHGDDDGDTTARAMRRDHRIAAEALRRLDSELDRTRREVASEREQESVCRRRERMAAAIDDLETARIAGEYAERHAERAALFERKADVLEAERVLLQRDIEVMTLALEQRGIAAQVEAGPADDGDPDRGRRRTEGEFRTMERTAREREAEARLEELKRKLR